MMIEGISSAIESFDPKPLGTQMLCLDLNICPVCRKWTAEPLFNGEDGIGRDADFHQRISCSQSASKAPAVTVYDDPAGVVAGGHHYYPSRGPWSSTE